MSYKSKFHGREIDAQIQYVKESLPTIIDGITKNIESLSKNKAENSSVPQKTSQITNDSDYITGKVLEEALSITTEDIINTLRTEHVEHLWGSDIDTKYKVGEHIPSLMIYESGNDIDHQGGYTAEPYKNAPFDWDGFILTHSCLYDNGDGTTSPFTYQFAISSNGKFVYRAVSDEEFADVPWSGNLVVGEKTDEGGEIFNDYDNNRAISKYSSAKNKNNLSGAMAFTILGVDENTKTYTLDSVKGLAVGDVYSMHTHYENSDGLEISRQRMDYGAITSIDNTTNTVTVDNIFVLEQKDLDAGYVFAPLSEERWYTDGLDNEENTFRIITKPMIGTRKIGYATSTSGYDNQAHSKGASSRGRDNISYGSYADTSGKNNKAGYCAFSTGIENHSKAETAFTANKGNVVTANQGAAFGSSNEVNGTNGFGVGNKNKIGKNSTSSFVGGEGNFVANNGTSQQSFTFGKGHYNNADQSAIFGLRNKTTKSAAFVANSDNEANAVNTAVFGQGNTAVTAGQMVRGRFSDPSSDYIDIVGYGDDKDNKKNVYTLSKKGVGWFREGLKIGGAKQSEGWDVATKNDVEKVESESHQLFSNTLKGSASDSFVSLGDVSPVPHTVKTNVHSKNLFNINDVYKASYFDYRVEDNKLILKKTNPNTTSYSNIFFTIGRCKDFSNKTLTLSITNESNILFSAHLVYFVNGVMVTKPLVNGGTLKTNNTTTFTKTVPDNNIEEMMCLRIVSQDTTVTDEEYTLSNIQVEYGTQATKYKPYVNIEDTTVKVCGKNLFNAYDLSYTSQGDRCKAETLGEGAIRVSVSKPSDFMNANVFLMKTASLEVGKVLYATANIAKGDEGNTAGLAIYAYNTTTKKGVTIHSYMDTSNTGKARCVVKLTDAHINNYDEIRLLFYYNGTSTTGWQVGDYVDYSNIMVTYGTEKAYEPYQGTEYTPDAFGNVDIASISPDMSIYSDNGVMINAEYNRDINKAFAELQAMILGG